MSEKLEAILTNGQLHEQVTPEVEGSELWHVAEPRGQAGDFVAACVQFRQIRHPNQFLGQGRKPVVRDQKDLQRQPTYFSRQRCQLVPTVII